MSGLFTPVERRREFSDLGVVLPGAKLYTYVAGSLTTQLATYSDSALSVPNANPVVASAGGLFGPIYLTPGSAYQFLLKDSSGVTVPGWPQDNVMAPATNALTAGTGVSISTVSGVSTITATGTVINSIGVCNFRLTLESGVAVSTTDQTAKATLYATPYNGNRIDLYDASGVPTTVISAQFSIAVPASTSQMYDVFAYSNAGVATLELLAWTNDTTRATALVLATTGAYTKTGDLTRRYLGSFRTTTVSGQTEDSLTKRYVWNYYNRVRRPLRRIEATATWNYNTNTIRQANAAAANQLDLVMGVLEAPIHIDVRASFQASATTNGWAGIGEDSTTTFLATAPLAGGNAGASAGAFTATGSSFDGFPATFGRHFYSWNERGDGGGATQTWQGTSTNNLSGITGWIDG